ncbi:hypothetical protein DSL92_03975 [Billgrantia gudaonensis]|uniref:Peptidase M41 domain-containing protein n=1 Tax=Billgrantia gudaonensis TaxID=376427 RepID=A0A3S0QG61_9GAMM|nr:hypothetical protein DSL92_03975 [Halomonas gudaonensis]
MLAVHPRHGLPTTSTYVRPRSPPLSAYPPTWPTIWRCCRAARPAAGRLACFSDARDRLLFGDADVGFSQSERHVVAYHESGHALLAYLLPMPTRWRKNHRVAARPSYQGSRGVPTRIASASAESYLRDPHHRDVWR